MTQASPPPLGETTYRRQPVRRSRSVDGLPKSFDRVRFQRSPPFITQGRRHFHVTGCGAQLPDNIKSAFHGWLQSPVAQRGQP